MKLDDFDFDLPEELIALEPLPNRSGSRLAHLDSRGNINDKNFTDIIELLQSGDVLVFNNTKVIKARVSGNISASKAEITLLKKLSDTKWQVLAKPGKKFSAGKIFSVSDELRAKVIDKNDEGIIILDFGVGEAKLFELLDKYVQMPLPPYIQKKRKADDSDDNRYQTVYAKKAGAVAAPTAGLHFNDEIINKLKCKGVKIAEVTLHVGAGTFLPVRVDDIKKHKMHSEYFEINEENATLINQAKQAGTRIVAVGTTSLRSLEAAAISTTSGKKYRVKPCCEDTEIFIYPGYEFKIIDVLITNFHLPKSTLLMLISAFSGMEEVKKLYEHCVRDKYRFFSYGDSCFLERK